jgi:hypothetical protein
MTTQMTKEKSDRKIILAIPMDFWPCKASINLRVYGPSFWTSDINLDLAQHRQLRIRTQFSWPIRETKKVK